MENWNFFLSKNKSTVFAISILKLNGENVQHYLRKDFFKFKSGQSKYFVLLLTLRKKKKNNDFYT